MLISNLFDREWTTYRNILLNIELERSGDEFSEKLFLPVGAIYQEYFSITASLMAIRKREKKMLFPMGEREQYAAYAVSAYMDDHLF